MHATNMDVDHGRLGDKSPRIWSSGTLMQIVPLRFCHIGTKRSTPWPSKSVFVSPGSRWGAMMLPISSSRSSRLGRWHPYHAYPTWKQPTFRARHASHRIPAISTPMATNTPKNLDLFYLFILQTFYHRFLLSFILEGNLDARMHICFAVLW